MRAHRADDAGRGARRCAAVCRGRGRGRADARRRACRLTQGVPREEVHRRRARQGAPRRRRGGEAGRDDECPPATPASREVQAPIDDIEGETSGENMNDISKTVRLMAAAAALTLVAASCGSDDESSDTTAARDRRDRRHRADRRRRRPTEATERRRDATSAPTDRGADHRGTDRRDSDRDHRAATGDRLDLDTNGDGKVAFGIAAAGPRDDGAYYQAVVDAADGAVGGERLRGADRRRQHPGRRRGHVDRRPRPAGRRRHHRRCVRDRRAAARS